jgi:hypothetical protein
VYQPNKVGLSAYSSAIGCRRLCFDADAKQMQERYEVARGKTDGQFGRTLIIPKDYERFEEHLKLLVVMMHDSAA